MPLFGRNNTDASAAFAAALNPGQDTRHAPPHLEEETEHTASPNVDAAIGSAGQNLVVNQSQLTRIVADAVKLAVAAGAAPVAAAAPPAPAAGPAAATTTPVSLNDVVSALQGFAATNPSVQLKRSVAKTVENLRRPLPPAAQETKARAVLGQVLQGKYDPVNGITLVHRWFSPAADLHAWLDAIAVYTFAEALRIHNALVYPGIAEDFMLGADAVHLLLLPLFPKAALRFPEALQWNYDVMTAAAAIEIAVADKKDTGAISGAGVEAELTVAYMPQHPFAAMVHEQTAPACAFGAGHKTLTADEAEIAAKNAQSPVAMRALLTRLVGDLKRGRPAPRAGGFGPKEKGQQGTQQKSEKNDKPPGNSATQTIEDTRDSTSSPPSVSASNHAESIKKRNNIKNDKQQQPPREQLVRGGDFYNCLSNHDIDAILGPVVGPGYIPADVLYKLGTRQTSPQAVKDRIASAAAAAHNGCAIAPLHVRHHWTIASFRPSSEPDAAPKVVVLDSARSAPTGRDIRRRLRMLDIGGAVIVSPARQPRGSNECGVHAIVNGLRLHFDFCNVFAKGAVDLAHLRTAFAQLALDTAALRRVAQHIAADPTAPVMHTRVGFGRVFSSHDFSGGATWPRTAAARDSAAADDHNTAQANLCYLFSAVRLARSLCDDSQDVLSLGDLRTLRARLGFPEGQQCMVEAFERLSAAQPLPVPYVVTAGVVPDVPADVDRFVQLDNIGVVAPPVGWRAEAHVWFVGRVGVVNGHKFGAHGHYTFRFGPPVPGPPPRHVETTAADGHMFDWWHEEFPCAVVFGRIATPPQVHVGPDAASDPPTEQPAQVVAPAMDAPAPAVDVAVARKLRTTVQAADAIIRQGEEARLRRAQARAAAATAVAPDAAAQPVPLQQRAAKPPAPEPLVTHSKAATTAAPPTGAPVAASSRRRHLTRTEIRSETGRWRQGDRVFAHWARDSLAGRWYGTVLQGGTNVEVEFDREVCEVCTATRAMTKVVTRLPAVGVMHFAVDKRNPPAFAPCVCIDFDPEDESVECPQLGTHESDQVNLDELRQAAPRTVDASPEGQPLGPLSHGPAAALRGDAGHAWLIYDGKPAGVHEVVWRQLSESTRRTHQRWLRVIRGMPSDLRSRPLAHAIVELIIRMASRRKWVWSTVASAFAACASALANLPVYTTETRVVLIRDDPYFSQAAKRAQQNARTTTGVESLTAALTHDEYRQLISSAGIKNNRVRLLLQLMWHFAARPKEMREARPYDIVFGEQLADRASHVSVTFVTGKVVPVCGPYTIHVVLPKEVVCELRGFINDKPAHKALFTENDQAALSKAIAAIRPGDQQRLGLRSVRRGALLHLAGRGVGDVELVQLSGHKRMDTLHRYLGWGRSSATMRLAASARHRAQITGGAEQVELPREDLPTTQQPPKMGPNSGFKGRAGKRVPKPPSFFPRKAPSREELGVAPRVDESAAYPLHIKPTSRVDFDQVLEMAAGTPLADAAALARRWCASDEFYGPTIRVEERKLPYAAFTADHVQQLLDADKIRPYTGDVRGFVKAFTLPNHQKKRLRVIAEPVINDTCSADFIPDLAYPSRLERRAKARGARFDAELDFSAYFDQFDLAIGTAPWMVLRARQEVAGHRLFTLTRLPMGAKFAPSVAQIVTSVLVFPLLDLPDVHVDTCIDNIRVVATSAGAFVSALRILLERIRRASITLNDAHLWEQSPDEWLKRCEVTDAPRVFLGERYVRDTVSNSDNCVAKLTDAWARFNEGHAPSVYTLRNFCSLVGLMLFMAHTINVDLSNYHTLLRAYGRIIADATGWDDPFTITSSEVYDQLQGFVAILLENAPVELPVLVPPSRSLQDYDAAIEVDASGSAWAAIVRLRDGRTFTLQQRWAYSVGHSAHAEPSAATRAVQWVRRLLGGCASVALVTDHRALATAQRRWNSNFGGFSSTGYHLNEFYRELYRAGGGQVFYVEGVSNQADALSRAPDAPLTLRVQEVEQTFRDLTLTEHPYDTIPRKPYQV